MKDLLAAGAAVAGLACLAACDRTAGASTVSNATPASPPITMPAAPAGRWAYVREIDGKESYRDERCRSSEDTLAEIMMLGTPPGHGCTRSIAEQGNGWTMHLACGSGEKTITVNTTVTGDFSTGYDVEAIRVAAPGVDDFTSQKITMHAERLGDC